MKNKLTFIFDTIDSNKGPLPNALSEALPSDRSIEELLRVTFSNFDVKFKSTYFVDDEDKWFYPIFINNLVYMNSLLNLQHNVPKKIRKGLQRKRGKIIVFITEPLNYIDDFRLLETLFGYETPNTIYCTLHSSTIPNMVHYYPWVFNNYNGDIEKDTSKKMLESFTDRKFSCFLYHYMGCPSRPMFLSFLENFNLLDDFFISVRNQGRDFDAYVEIMPETELQPYIKKFSQYDKVFDGLNVNETLDKSLINVVLEKELMYTNSQKLITEKVYRSVERSKPFIIFSHPGVLKYFRSQGFNTFSPVIDESYDDYDDINDRTKRILKEIKRLSSLSFEELGGMIKNLDPVFKHNIEVLRDNQSKAQNIIYKELHNGM